MEAESLIPVIFKPGEKDFTTNGLGRLIDATRCEITEEANGKYELEMDYPAISRFSDYFENGYQIKAKPNDLEEYHIFEIKQTFKDTFTNSIVIYAQSRTYKLGNRQVRLVTVDNRNGAEAMRLIEQNMDEPCDIKLHSDINTASSTIFEARNVLNCIAGEQGSLLQYWGGEIKREPFKLSLLRRRGRDNVKDLSSLNKVAGKYFTTLYPGSDKPKVSIELEIEKLTDSEEAKEFAKMRNYNLFDTFTVYHKFYDIDIQTKVTGIVYDALAEKTIKITAGDIQVAFYKQQSQDFQEAIKTLTKKDYMSNFIDYITDLINGVKGGSILQYPKNRPHTLYFMDTDSTDTAKNVIAINNQGIGFSTTGWKGPFRNAWTIDGILNADFIRAGKIRSDIFETSFNAYGDILRLVNGALQAWNGKTKIMELTKQGLEFWNGNSHIGSIGTKGNPFPDLRDVNGNLVVSDGNSLLLVADNPQKIIGLSNQSGAGHLITGLTQFFVGNKFNFFGPKGSKSTITVDRLIVGGKEVIPGDGSGGNDGDVPPELTTEKEKNAWAVWQFLKSKGYSEQATAGILGNMDQESGIMPDIDEGGGGPGYGLVQWTSPIAGESGRAYVQRLLGQAGISGDYRNINTQLQLLEWHMHNGQYIPSAAYPYSVAEFKALTDIGTATMAFEANFERPAVTHPERIPLAQYWYNLLKDLKPSKPTWMNPVRSSYTITQEWDEPDYASGGAAGIHGGIDIASMPAGSMPPVYVARNGTVITATYDGTGGNYVVIQHDDGYYTYYGHLDSVDLAVGDKVTTTNKVGIMGATGTVTGVHLHFEVWKGGQWQRINPRDVINF